MRHALVPIFVATLLAGCMGGDDAPPETAATDEPSSTADASSAKSPPGLPMGTAASNASNASMKSVPFAWDGHIGRSACLPSGPNSCTGAPLPLGSSETFQAIEGNVTSVALTMSWTASTPLTEDLFLSAFVVKSCGEGCFEGTDTSASVSGASPLVLEMSGLRLEEGETVGVHVTRSDPSCHGAVVVYGCLNVLDQDFHVEGTVLVVA